MRISDWSSDVCSSDLLDVAPEQGSVQTDAAIQQFGLQANFIGLDLFRVGRLGLKRKRVVGTGLEAAAYRRVRHHIIGKVMIERDAVGEGVRLRLVSERVRHARRGCVNFANARDDVILLAVARDLVMRVPRTKDRKST